MAFKLLYLAVVLNFVAHNCLVVNMPLMAHDPCLTVGCAGVLIVQIVNLYWVEVFHLKHNIKFCSVMARGVF